MNPTLASADTAPQPQTQPQASAREFLAFRLGEEEYGVDVLRVQEIRSYEKPTRIAGAPEFVMGVINLRGVIVPVVDMRVKLQIAQPAYDAFTVVIVLQLGHRMVGMVVDAVSDVIALDAAQMRPAPAVPAVLSGEHLLGLGMLDERLLILVDVDKLMASPGMGLLATRTERLQ